MAALLKNLKPKKPSAAPGMDDMGDMDF